ncbi:MAG: glycosyltransferase family 87 protein [Anaerolineae bacterium]
MHRAARTALIAWAAITLMVAASLLLIGLRQGAAGFAAYIQQPPLINLPVTLSSVGLLWLSAGALLYLLASGRVLASNALSVAGFFVVCWVYLNILSERFRYGDYQYYFDAATRLASGQPLPATYFYPPLWATLTQFLTPLGEDGFFLVLWFLNLFSLLLFYGLLHRALERYGFSARLAALVATLFLLVNVPVLRTLVYVQVNLHALNLLLLSILLYPRRSFASALTLALAVHLKSSPAVLVLAFLLQKDWRWLGWFALSMLGIAGLTMATSGIAPFLDVLRNLQGLALSQNTIFHDTSFDSFLRFVAHVLGMSPAIARVVAYVVKAGLLAAVVMIMLRAVRLAEFAAVDTPGSPVLNAAPPLFILMTLASPVVWEHHGVFLALPFLLLLKRLDRPADWIWFAFAYLLEFLLPTFDFFPWSFGRLLAPLIILWLMWRTAGPPASHLFPALNAWFEMRAAADV